MISNSLMQEVYKNFSIGYIIKRYNNGYFRKIQLFYIYIQMFTESSKLLLKLLSDPTKRRLKSYGHIKECLLWNTRRVHVKNGHS